MPQAKFLSGAGKCYELARKITNAVLDLGGNEDDVLRILKDDEHRLVHDIAMLIVGQARTEALEPEVVATTAKNPDIRKKLVMLVRDPEVLLKIATTDESSKVREEAIGFISDENFLYRLTEEGCRGMPDRLAEHAVEKIEKQDYLVAIAMLHGLLSVRYAAIKRLDLAHLRHLLINIDIHERVQDVAGHGPYAFLMAYSRVQEEFFDDTAGLACLGEVADRERIAREIIEKERKA